MVRKPYIDKKGLKRGAWSEEEDNKLRAYVLRYKAWNWNLLPRFAGLARCGKSCRMRWENYLKPGVKRGGFSKDEEELILKMQKEHGNKWSLIAKRMPGRTDNEIKNYWHTILSMRIKQNQNSFGFIEDPIETSEEEMHCVDQRENADNGNAANGIADNSLSEITFSEAIEARKESNRVFGSESSETYMSPHNQVLPTTNVDSYELFGDVLMVENCLYPKTFSPITSLDTASSFEELLLVNSSNSEEALPTTYPSFTPTEDMILNLEESFFAASESFNLEPFLIDENNSYSSSTGSDICPWLTNFPSPSCSSRLETHDSWSPDENSSASLACISTEPFSTDALNMPFLDLETSTLLGRLDSLESFGFWKALWNSLK